MVQSLGRLLAHILNNRSALLHAILEFDLALKFNSDLKLQRRDLGTTALTTKYKKYSGLLPSPTRGVQRCQS